MVRRLRIFLVVLWMVAAQAAPAQRPQEPAPYTDPDAYDVYSALIPGLRTSRFYVIQESIPAIQFSVFTDPCFSKKFQREYRELLKNFDEANRRPLRLLRKFHLDESYELLQPGNGGSESGEGGWGAFHKRFPGSGGIISMSAVGFNKKKTEAFVWIGFSCGPLCGSWSYRLLEKREGGWREIEIPGGRCSMFS